MFGESDRAPLTVHTDNHVLFNLLVVLFTMGRYFCPPNFRKLLSFPFLFRGWLGQK